jgi:uncharacterized protein YukE
MTDIYSNHPQNFQHFDDMQQAINALADFHEQLNNLYTTLQPIWVGTTADAMQQQKVQYSQQLDGYQQELQAQQQWGVNKVQDFISLDNRLAGGI